MRTAWTFPGHGSQMPGMGRQLLAECSRANEVLRMAEDMSGLQLDRYRLRGPSEDLMQPSIAEPLITALQIGYVEHMTSLGLRPDAVVGYSAGETAALYAAGAIKLESALQVALLRGRILSKYTTSDCRMLTVARISVEQIESKLAELNDRGCRLSIGARNGEKHVTLVGNSHDIDQAENAFGQMKAELGPVQVAGPWHSNQLSNASLEISKELEAIPFATPIIPILTSASGIQRESPEALRHDLAFGVSQPVLWESVVEKLVGNGIKRFVECGSGRVLFGLLRWSLADPNSYQSICVEDRGGGIRPLKKLVMEHNREKGN